MMKRMLKLETKFIFVVVVALSSVSAGVHGWAEETTRPHSFGSHRCLYFVAWLVRF